MKKLINISCTLVFFMFILATTGIDESFAVGETSRMNYQISNGVTESTVYVSVDGGQNVRTHILRISEKAGIEFKASYGGYYSNQSTVDYRKKKAKKWGDNDWTFESLREQVRNYASVKDSEGDVIAASNADFFDIGSGKPEGSLVIEGNILRRNSRRPFFAVLKSGKAVIRRAGSRLSDTTDLVSGNPILIWKGSIVVDRDDERKPRTAIGICRDGAIVIVSVDGREPASAGVTLYELADILKAQNCKTALNLDGGGSVSFMTKRTGDAYPQFRSNHSDGPERNIGPALLIVRKTKESQNSFDIPEDAEYAASMSNPETRLWQDGNGVFRYMINGKKQTGFFAINGETYLFSRGKGQSLPIKIGNTTYAFVKGRLKRTTDSNAGNVIIGYCGAEGQTGKNLIYAYHKGDNLLNIGINPFTSIQNGKMKNWTHDTMLEIPWYSVRADITSVYIGDGVVNLGDYFLYSTRGHMTGGASAPVCKLKKIRLPDSVKTIGAYSLFNKPMLSSVVIRSKVKTIEKYALAYSGAGTIRFTGNTPPVFKRMAMKKTGFKTVYIRNSKAWKAFVKRKRFKTYGYKRAVKYR